MNETNATSGTNGLTTNNAISECDTDSYPLLAGFSAKCDSEQERAVASVLDGELLAHL